MAITFVGSNTGTSLSGGSMTISLPATVQNDLVLVISCSASNDSNIVAIPARRDIHWLPT